MQPTRMQRYPCALFRWLIPSSFLTSCSEFWVKNHERIVYAIHGGPMNGRRNYQTA